jgi:hypothetical protein
VGDGTCWPGFPPHNGISRECGYADHSPLWARIKLDCWVKKLQVGVRFGATRITWIIWYGFIVNDWRGRDKATSWEKLEIKGESCIEAFCGIMA